jgi:hypothetical protein
MTSEPQEWVACPTPEIGDILKWREPLWAAPNKPRGKRDQIGEQEIVAVVLSLDSGTLNFKVDSAVKTSEGNALVSVQKDDEIKRKASSLEKGNVQKRVS